MDLQQLYTIEVEDIAGAGFGCKASKEVTLLFNQTEIFVLNSDITALDQNACFANGSIVINKITEDRKDGNPPVETTLPGGYTGFYNVELLDQTLVALDPITNLFANFNSATGEFGNTDIPSGTYFLQVTNLATLCTSTQPTQVALKNTSRNPVVDITMESPDFACAGTNFTGVLAPDIFGGSDNVNNIAEFSVEWFVKGSAVPLGGANIDSDPLAYFDKAVNLQTGDYTIVVTDNLGLDAGCISTRDFTVTQARRDIVIAASATNQITCSPDGTAIIASISEDNIAQADPFAGWNIFLLDSDQNIVPGPITGTGTSADPFIGLGPNNYFLRVRNNSTECFSDPFQVVINDVSQDPRISVVMENPDFACAGTNFTGVLAPDIFGGSDNVNNIAEFSVEWFVKGSAVPLGGANIDSDPLAYFDKAINLQTGDYTIVVTDNLGLDAGCISTRDFTVTQARRDIVIAASATNQITCSPDGTAIIASMLDSDQNIVPGPITGTGTSADPFSGLGPNNYFLRVRNNSTLCFSDPFQVVINDVSRSKDQRRHGIPGLRLRRNRLHRCARSKHLRWL
jgi:hypothetical protein